MFSEIEFDKLKGKYIKIPGYSDERQKTNTYIKVDSAECSVYPIGVFGKKVALIKINGEIIDKTEYTNCYEINFKYKSCDEYTYILDLDYTHYYKIIEISDDEFNRIKKEKLDAK